MRARVHSKTGKPVRCNGVVFGVEPTTIDTEKLDWNSDQLAEFRSSERYRALYIFDLDLGGQLRDDGPTMEEFLAKGYDAASYPPEGYTEKRSPAASHYRRLQRQDRERKAQPSWMSAMVLPAPAVPVTPPAASAPAPAPMVLPAPAVPVTPPAASAPAPAPAPPAPTPAPPAPALTDEPSPAPKGKAKG